MADEDISLNEDQLLENLDDGNNGDTEFLNEVSEIINGNIHLKSITKIDFQNWCQVLCIIL